jgi:hypothetical protein
MNSNPPNARYKNIVVQELKDETLVCDLNNNRVYCLNKTAAEVWKLSDGKHETTEIAHILSKKFKTTVSNELVAFALEELSKEDLLAENFSTTPFFNNLSRREVIRQVGLASMIALPLISSIVMPTAANAQSGCLPDLNGNLPAGCPCSPGINTCATGCCSTTTNTCESSGSAGCSCIGCRDCASNCCVLNICQSSRSTCLTAPDCGLTVACPAGFTCCDPANPLNDSACSACGC